VINRLRVLLLAVHCRASTSVNHIVCNKLPRLAQPSTPLDVGKVTTGLSG